MNYITGCIKLVLEVVHNSFRAMVAVDQTDSLQTFRLSSHSGILRKVRRNRLSCDPVNHGEAGCRRDFDSVDSVGCLSQSFQDGPLSSDQWQSETVSCSIFIGFRNFISHSLTIIPNTFTLQIFFFGMDTVINFLFSQKN
jgi:hypothetical protein